MPKDLNIIKVQMDEFSSILTGKEYDFPKYTTQIINLANQDAQATRPKVVGQMSELIVECGTNDYSAWGEWYIDHYPDAIEEATDRIMVMIENLKEAITLIDREMVEAWVRDLVITKTFIGLKVQQGILIKLSELKSTSYRLATPEEESKGIDGYIGNIPISIKPLSYKTKDMLREKIDVKIIYYDKKKDHIEIHAHDLFGQKSLD